MNVTPANRWPWRDASVGRALVAGLVGALANTAALGLRLSPLTPLLSFALNAIYGLVLGALCRPRSPTR